MSALPIGYRKTNDPEVIQVFYCVCANVERKAIDTEYGRIVVAAQLYEAGARVAHERMVEALFEAPEYEEREPLSKTEITTSFAEREAARRGGEA